MEFGYLSVVYHNIFSTLEENTQEKENTQKNKKNI